jgi:hypothetical protein
LRWLTTEVGRDRVGCQLGVSLDGERTVVVARGTDGKVAGRYDGDRGQRRLDAAHLVPTQLAEGLRACAQVEVIARPPLEGRPELLPPSLAWSYRAGRAAAPPTANRPPRQLIVSSVEAPARLHLPPLVERRAPKGVLELRGPAATPSRVLDELASATEVELDVHGLPDSGVPDASLLVLAPEPSGRFALTAGELRRARLSGAPLVILGACHPAEVAPHDRERWSLPAAFLEAGARAVVVAPAPLGEDAGAFFDELRARAVGQPLAAALRDEKQAWLAKNPSSWVRDVTLFD